jgi:hypothetical protein
MMICWCFGFDCVITTKEPLVISIVCVKQCPLNVLIAQQVS